MCLRFQAHRYLFQPVSESMGHGVGDGFLRFPFLAHNVYVPGWPARSYGHVSVVDSSFSIAFSKNNVVLFHFEPTVVVF